jgi:hypothetical protein
MPRLLDEIYRLQRDLTEVDNDERRLLKMFANLLESHYGIPEPRNRLSLRSTKKSPDDGSLWMACSKIIESGLER